MIDQKYDPIDNVFKREGVTLNELKRRLVQYTGRTLKMGKELNYYETELEKLLSMMNDDDSAPFPGDCDLLLFDNKYSCRCIIEFKKRTKFGSKLSISEQSFENYLIKDKLKYQRLNILRKYLEKRSDIDIPLINVYYSVADDDELNKIKIEEITHELTAGDNEVFSINCKAMPWQNQFYVIQKIMELTS